MTPSSTNLPFTIEKVTDQKSKSIICEKLLRSLPECFGVEELIIKYINNVSDMDTWAARMNDEVVGFISLNKHNRATAEIHVIAESQKCHRSGIGRTLDNTALVES